MEELHFDISANWQRLGDFEKHVLVLATRVRGVRCVDLHLQLEHHKLGICKKSQRCATGGHVCETCEERRDTENTRVSCGRSGGGMCREGKARNPVLLHESGKKKTAHRHHLSIQSANHARIKEGKDNTSRPKRRRHAHTHARFGFKPAPHAA